MAADRFACSCSCDCEHTAGSPGSCVDCLVGAHRPIAAIREHLSDSARVWGRLAATATSPARLRSAVELWWSWHAGTGCPTGFHP